jgi:hypothetical protein
MSSRRSWSPGGRARGRSSTWPACAATPTTWRIPRAAGAARASPLPPPPARRHGLLAPCPRRPARRPRTARRGAPARPERKRALTRPSGPLILSWRRKKSRLADADFDPLERVLSEGDAAGAPAAFDIQLAAWFDQLSGTSTGGLLAIYCARGAARPGWDSGRGGAGRGGAWRGGAGRGGAARRGAAARPRGWGAPG